MAGVSTQEQEFGQLPDIGFADFISANSVTTYQGQDEQTNSFSQSTGLQDFRAEMQSIKTAAETARKIVAAASWSERPCNPPPSGGATLIPDPGVTVVLPGSKPGESSVLPPPTPTQPVPENPEKPDSGTSTPEENDGGVYYIEAPIVPAYTVVPVKVPIFNEGRNDRQKKGGPKEEVKDNLVLMPFGGSPLLAVANLADTNKCCTFGNNPRVILNPPTKISLARAVRIPPVDLRIAFDFSLTPIQASFGRTGLCWQGICETPNHEILAGTVFATMAIKLTINVTAPIKIGRRLITAQVFYQDALTIPRHASYTLQCGNQGH